MFKTILVALNEPKLASDLMEAINQLRWHPEATLILSHIMLPSEDIPSRDATLPGSAPAEITQQQIEEDLRSHQADLPAVPTRIEVALGDPAEEIVRLANIYEADLIILGNRGLTGLNRILQGSVSSQVLEDAHCSVMVIKSRLQSDEL
ncbi:MAG: universal stress protein [Cyanobacteria bacterium Co-bin13]|nr:universal stress protein [Cyanobacteria bacterium Co-bin13]